MTHVDVTLAGVRSIVHELYEDISAQILESRFQVITVWRPLQVPVRDWPLALCDASSIDGTNLVDSDVIYPNYLAENRLVHFNEKQKWYWLPDQIMNEVFLFKAVDSDKSTSHSPHGALPLPNQDEASPTRESIDVRLLVMYADMVYPESKPWSS